MDRFIINPSEDIIKELKRILNSQAILIQEMACDKSNGIHENVHEMRKRFKMIRSVIRLIRDTAGYSVYYRENIRFRDLSRKLSAVRDSEVLLQKAIHLCDTIPELREDQAYLTLISKLTQERDTVLHRLLHRENVCDHIRDSLEAFIPVLYNINLEKTGFDAIEKGIKRMYRQAGKYLQIITENHRDPETIHTLRKRVKYLWYQIQLLQEIYPEQMNALAASLDQLADKLGIFRDNYLFQLSLQRNDFHQLKTRYSSKITWHTERENAENLEIAINIAKKFFGEKPKHFTGKLRKWYNISQNPNKNHYENKTT